ncbi:MAG: NAD(P)/FAD-dependent oxidoreductase [Nanoarchaeota archaeon]|nr:NAD(P)/FAD-dependent oxidoreductase [Nanoarchaeota archaeon]MBU1269873.1 NAD(P)/FAD-dependent oxidoreductase [Nanoarchaeota archaeon]MBU1604269.1 NAD(P)/FAD-dependent oxidoreductase [Nanoarchaeota archaeon]MBU2443679.1 NAD(P)/FAD-dependent oxidoreductase [Nanoarchaeota archaeon]
MKAYDLVVVGAGPAGSSAAMVAAKAGLRVALIDKKEKIGFPKQCAEGINHEAFSFLKLKVKNDWVSNKIDSFLCSSPGKGSIYIKRPGTKGYVLDRKKFDLDLAMMAQSEGADLFVGTRIIGLEKNNCVVKLNSGQSLKTKLLIAADGPFSSVARMVGSETVKNGVGLQYELNGSCDLSHSIHAYIGLNVVEQGWGWIFPKNNTLNVGIGSFNTVNLKTKLDLLVKNLGLQRRKILEVNGGLIPLHGPIKKIYHDNIMFVGDAAGHTNPVSGGGIPAAIFDGQLAARVAVEELEKNSFDLSRYQSEWEQSVFGPAMKISLDVQKMFLKSLKKGDFDKFFEKITFEEITQKRELFKLISYAPSLKSALEFAVMGWKYYKPYKYAW